MKRTSSVSSSVKSFGLNSGVTDLGVVVDVTTSGVVGVVGVVGVAVLDAMPWGIRCLMWTLCNLGKESIVKTSLEEEFWTSPVVFLLAAFWLDSFATMSKDRHWVRKRFAVGNLDGADIEDWVKVCVQLFGHDGSGFRVSGRRHGSVQIQQLVGDVVEHGGKRPPGSSCKQKKQWF